MLGTRSPSSRAAPPPGLGTVPLGDPLSIRPLSVRQRQRRRSRSLVSTTALTLIAAPLAVLSTAAPAQAADPVDIQILGTNDFHGRILDNAPQGSNPGGPEAGAAVLSGAVKQLRAGNPNTVFAAAGDLIGASTFESFIQQDKPTIDALNEAGLDVSAVGNHEFDQGYRDLVDRVMKPYDPSSNPQGGARWRYLGENVRFKADDSPALDGTWIKEMGGVQVGFVGAVTEHLPELVSPAGIADIKVTDIVQATNAAADDLVADGADLVVMLVHEGAPSVDCATMDDDPTSDFGSIVTGVNDNVDAIVSGHTHLAYNCSLPVPGWAARPVKERPVVSAGQYGINLNRLTFTVDPDDGVVSAKTQEILKLKTDPATPNYPPDPAMAPIIDAAVTEANELGARVLGRAGGVFSRAKLANGTTENRGAESTLGNLVAEIQRWATSSPTTGSAQIAFMNPGGLRADLAGTVNGDQRDVTYRQAAEVQPFANTLVNKDLTGARIKEALEQQWQPAGASRPFLRLGASKGFTWTYDPTRAQGSRITGMWLNGRKIEPAATYSVTINSFLAGGGDNFGAFAGGPQRDTGQTDLQASVAYLDELASTAPLAVDYTQRSVGVTFPTGAPAAYAPGQPVGFALTSLSMTAPGDLVDDKVSVRLGNRTLGSFDVTTTIQTDLPGVDEAGRAEVLVRLPAGTPGGPAALRVTGDTTGTTTVVPITVRAAGRAASKVTAAKVPRKIEVGTKPKIKVRVTTAGEPASGRVTVFAGGEKYHGRLKDSGRTTIKIAPFARPGTKTVRVKYLGNATTRQDKVKLTFDVGR
jgi:5'-nucleotidase